MQEEELASYPRIASEQLDGHSQNLYTLNTEELGELGVVFGNLEAVFKDFTCCFIEVLGRSEYGLRVEGEFTGNFAHFFFF